MGASKVKSVLFKELLMSQVVQQEALTLVTHNEKIIYQDRIFLVQEGNDYGKVEGFCGAG